MSQLLSASQRCYAVEFCGFYLSFLHIDIHILHPQTRFTIAYTTVASPRGFVMVSGDFCPCFIPVSHIGAQSSVSKSTVAIALPNSVVVYISPESKQVQGVRAVSVLAVAAERESRHMQPVMTSRVLPGKFR